MTDFITAARVQALKERVIALVGKRSGYGSDVLTHRISASADPTEVPGDPVDSTVRELKNFLLDFHDFDDDNTIREDSYFPEDLDHLDSRISTLETGNESSHGCRGACTGLCTGTCTTVCSGCTGTATTSTVATPAAALGLSVPVGTSGQVVLSGPSTGAGVSISDVIDEGATFLSDEPEPSVPGTPFGEIPIPLIPMRFGTSIDPVTIHEVGVVQVSPFLGPVSSSVPVGGSDVGDDPYAFALIAGCTEVVCSSTCTGTCSPSLGGTSCSDMCTSCVSGCSDICLGTCSRACANNCSGTCSGTCTATCADDCTGGCKTGCNTTCKGSCSGGCNTTCRGSCRGGCNTTCTATCANDCTGGCKGGCNTTCTATCANDCTGGCKGGCYTTCTATCANDCTNTCKGTCKQGCQTGCQATCSASCSETCSTTCYRDCEGTCYGTASAPVSR